MRIEYEDRVYKETSRNKVIYVNVKLSKEKACDFIETYPNSWVTLRDILFDTLSVTLNSESELSNLSSHVEGLGGVVTSYEDHIVSKGQITHKDTGILIGEW